uniref:Uncharacterized protein n=1 Tax=Ditylenchus dipsaci TaxID=166011 RepID=A0A915DML7_9BILA
MSADKPTKHFCTSHTERYFVEQKIAEENLGKRKLRKKVRQGSLESWFDKAMVILESSRITSATRIRGNTTRKVIILQHIAFAIVSFNIIHGLIMFLLSSTFASLIFQFPSFAIFWAISLIAALLALKDKKFFCFILCFWLKLL